MWAGLCFLHIPGILVTTFFLLNQDFKDGVQAEVKFLGVYYLEHGLDQASRAEGAEKSPL